MTVPLSALAQALKIQAVFACLWAFALGVATPLWNTVIRILDWAWPRVARQKSFLDRLNVSSITDQMEPDAGAVADAKIAACAPKRPTAAS